MNVMNLYSTHGFEESHCSLTLLRHRNRFYLGTKIMELAQSKAKTTTVLLHSVQKETQTFK